MTGPRSALGYLAAFAALAVVLGVCMGAWSLGQPPRAAASPTPLFVGPSPQPSPSPSPAPTATLSADSLRPRALGALPEDARYVIIGDAGDERVLLLDTAGRRVLEAAHFEGLAPSGPDRRIESTSSADGSTVIMLSIWDAAQSRLMVLRPATGDVRVMNIATSEAPRLSPDGSSIVVTRSRDPSVRGIWLISLADGRGTRIVEDPAGRTTSRPIAWSRDGKWLAIVTDAVGADPQIALVDPATRDVRVLGPGRNARWRGNELFVWSERPGAGVAVYDVAGGARREAFATDAGTRTDLVELRPGSSDVAALEGEQNAIRQVVLHAATTSVLLKDAQFLLAMWWSRDGAHLYAWTTFNGTETVTDLIGGGTVLQFCRRQKVSPPCG